MKKTIFYIIIALLLFTGSSAKAGTSTYTLLEPLPCVQGVQNVNCTTDKNGQSVVEKIDVNQYISYIFKFAIALAVFLTVVMVIYGGFKWMLSESVFDKSSAKETIKDAVMGLGAALLSYLILQTIDPRLVQIQTTIPVVCPPTDSRNNSSTADIDICKKNTEVNFESSLVNQLREQNLTNRTAYANLDSQISDLQKQQTDLQNKIAAPGGNTLENQNALRVVQQNISETGAQKDLLAARDLSSPYVINEIKQLHDDKNTYDGSTGNLTAGQRQLLQDAKSKISSIYAGYLSDPTLQDFGNPAVKQQMEFQEKFYLDQIDTESAFMAKVIQYDRTPGAGALQVGIDQDMDKYTKEYSALTTTAVQPDETLAKIKADPVLSEQYKTILTDRINILNGVIMKKANTTNK